MAATARLVVHPVQKQLNLRKRSRKEIRCGTAGRYSRRATPSKATQKWRAEGRPPDEDEGGSYGSCPRTPPRRPQPRKPPPPPPATKAKKGTIDAEDEDGSNPYGVTETDLTPRCPHCAKEMESAEAIVCLHCGHNTQTRKKPEIKRVYDITSQDKTMWILPGIINIFLIFFLIGLDIFFVFGLEKTWKWLDDETTEALSKGIRVWFVGGSMFAMWKCGRFAVQRLILTPVPPEEERK